MKTNWFLPLLLLALFGCVQKINLTSGDRQVVVECILSEAPEQTLLLSLTNGVSGIGPDALEDAVAALVDMTAGELAGYFVRREDGVRILEYAALPEHSYRLEIDVPGYGSVWAEDTMPPAVNVFYGLLFHVFQVVQDIDSSYFFHRVHWHTNEEWGLAEHDTYEPTSVYYFQTASLPDHLLVEGFVYDAESEVYNLCRTLCTDCPGVIGTNLDGTVYRSEIFRSDYDCYKENPLLDGASNYIHYLKIDKKKALEQAFFTIWGAFNWDSFKHRDYLLFSALSENYSAYIDNAASRLQGYSDLATLFSRDSSFSNIEGGVGVFGSRTTGILPAVQRAHVWWEQYQPMVPQTL